MLNKIEKTYTKDSIIIIGDWSICKQMKNFLFNDKLQERFKGYDIDKYRIFVLITRQKSYVKTFIYQIKQKRKIDALYPNI